VLPAAAVTPTATLELERGEVAVGGDAVTTSFGLRYAASAAASDCKSVPVNGMDDDTGATEAATVESEAADEAAATTAGAAAEVAVAVVVRATASDGAVTDSAASDDAALLSSIPTTTFTPAPARAVSD
jgi:hypothetical protein